MSTPSGDGGTGDGQAGSPTTTEPPAPSEAPETSETSEAPPDTNESPADAPTAEQEPAADGTTQDESAASGGADTAPAPTPPPEPAGEENPGTAEEPPAGGDSPEDGTTDNADQGNTGADKPAAPGDTTQEQDSAATESPGQDSPPEGEEGAFPGMIPGAEVVPPDDEFKTRVREQAPAIETPASILDDIGQDWRNTGGEADSAHSEGTGGMDTVTQSWNDPAHEDMRRRADPLLDETRGVRDSANAMDEQVRRANEQAGAAAEGMERNIERQAPGYYLATATLPPGESDVAGQRIIDITAAGNRDIAHQAADNIANDPGWDGVETRAAPPDPTPGRLAQADVLANAGAGVGGWQAGQTFGRKADFWSMLSEKSKSYVPITDGADGIIHQSNVRRGAVNASHFTSFRNIADKVGKFGGPALGLPLAYVGYQNDIENGESPQQAGWSNGGGWAAGAATGLAIGTAVGGPVGAVLGALGGAAAGAITSGAIDSYFENGTASPYDDNLPQA